MIVTVFSREFLVKGKPKNSLEKTVITTRLSFRLLVAQWMFLFCKRGKKLVEKMTRVCDALAKFKNDSHIKTWLLLIVFEESNTGHFRDQ